MIVVKQIREKRFSFDIALDDSKHLQAEMLRVLNEGYLYEPETDLIAERMDRNAIFIDVGAHVGWYTLLAASLGAFTYAFEPETENYTALLGNLALNPRFLQPVFPDVKPSHSALGDKFGVAELFICADNEGAHGLWDVRQHPLHKITIEKGYTTRVQPVWMQRLSFFIGDLHSQPPLNPHELWIKIDAEGSEAMIVKEALPLIKRRVRAGYFTGMPTLILEINPFCLEQMGSSEDELRKMLYDEGYISYVASDRQWIRIAPDQKVKGMIVNMVFSKTPLEKAPPTVAAEVE